MYYGIMKINKAEQKQNKFNVVLNALVNTLQEIKNTLRQKISF